MFTQVGKARSKKICHTFVPLVYMFCKEHESTGAVILSQMLCASSIRIYPFAGGGFYFFYYCFYSTFITHFISIYPDVIVV